ncbi:MAG: nicotinate-nucleotide--dimethylbenzimidazole phosphoribosyltransferase [Clostridia bacterium]|nr:nicotinate-nucleotide--dimethylbenzimidazole phosphoribosyltransferase [Clostridia bacterium]
MFEQLCKTLDKDSMIKAKNRLDSLSKPLESLGWLEHVIIRLCGIYHTDSPDIMKKVMVIMCADNGVVEEGVSQVGQEVTSIVAENFTRNITAINHFTNYMKQDIHIVDIGMSSDSENLNIHNHKIMNGTCNMVKGPAMTKKQALDAINIGIDIVKEMKSKGYKLIGTGEMGIGNTTTSTAILHVFTGYDLDLITGKGAGLSGEGLEKKKNAIMKACQINLPDKNDPIDVLSKVGGLDIAGMCGLFIGGAIYGIPVVIDGFISSVAALVASRICPNCIEFMIQSHGSHEPGTKYVFEQLGMEPVLNMKMRLGEGTGASMIMGIIDLAFYTYYHMGTFKDANVEQYKKHE